MPPMWSYSRLDSKNQSHFKEYQLGVNSTHWLRRMGNRGIWWIQALWMDIGMFFTAFCAPFATSTSGGFCLSTVAGSKQFQLWLKCTLNFAVDSIKIYFTTLQRGNLPEMINASDRDSGYVDAEGQHVLVTMIISWLLYSHFVCYQGLTPLTSIWMHKNNLIAWWSLTRFPVSHNNKAFQCWWSVS